MLTVAVLLVTDPALTLPTLPGLVQVAETGAPAAVVPLEIVVAAVVEKLMAAVVTPLPPVPTTDPAGTVMLAVGAVCMYGQT